MASPKNLATSDPEKATEKVTKLPKAVHDQMDVSV